MTHARTFSLLAASALLGTLVISQGLAQDPPPAKHEAHAEEAPAADATQDDTAAPATDAATTPAKKLPPLDLRRISPLVGDAVAGKTKAEVCSACHGAEGIAIAPLFPNLAGQHAEYLYWQLQEYQRGNIPPSTMTPLVTDLTDTDMRDLAAYYAGLPRNPPMPATAPADGEDVAPAPSPPDPALLAQGEGLYLGGDVAKGIPACQGCHGADALGFTNALKPNRNGHVPYAVFPVLRGQQPDYLQARLTQYQTGDIADSSTDMVMNHVGHRLDADSISALSAYLSSLNGK